MISDHDFGSQKDILFKIPEKLLFLFVNLITLARGEILPVLREMSPYDLINF